jgi:hypothetical protein
MYFPLSLYHGEACPASCDNTQNMRAVVSEEVTRMGPYLRNFGKISRVRRTPFQVVFIRPRRLGR